MTDGKNNPVDLFTKVLPAVKRGWMVKFIEVVLIVQELVVMLRLRVLSRMVGRSWDEFGQTVGFQLVTIPLYLLQPSRLRKVSKSKQVLQYVQVLRERGESSFTSEGSS